MSVAPVDRIRVALDHLRENLAEETVADLLEGIARSASADAQAGALTAEQEEVLTRAGMPPVEMPPLAERASTLTWRAFTRIAAEAYNAADVAGLLDVGASRVRQHVARRTLLTIKTSDGPRFPRFQFVDGRILPGWDVVAPRFPLDAHPVAVEAFLTRVSEELEVDGQLVSPFDWLTSGGDADVVAALVDEAYRIA